MEEAGILSVQDTMKNITRIINLNAIVINVMIDMNTKRFFDTPKELRSEVN